MKKRNEQKLIAVGLILFLVFNLPLLFVYNKEGSIWGIPVFYFVIFSIWGLGVCISYIILYKYYE